MRPWRIHFATLQYAIPQYSGLLRISRLTSAVMNIAFSLLIYCIILPAIYSVKATVALLHSRWTWHRLTVTPRTFTFLLPGKKTCICPVFFFFPFKNVLFSVAHWSPSIHWLISNTILIFLSSAKDDTKLWFVAASVPDTRKRNSRGVSTVPWETAVHRGGIRNRLVYHSVIMC